MCIKYKVIHQVSNCVVIIFNLDDLHFLLCYSTQSEYVKQWNIRNESTKICTDYMSHRVYKMVFLKDPSSYKVKRPGCAS